MGTSTLAGQIDGFFAAANTRDLLVLTTFGLDEAVALRLLERTNYRGAAVILYDAARRRNPGLLRLKFPRVHLAGVILPEVGETCPVFHSKLWMSLDSKSLAIRRLAVHSFNLTRFHLEEGDRRSFESWMSWQGLSLEMPQGLRGLVSRSLRAEDCILSGVRAKTILIDSRQGRLAISEAAKPAGALMPLPSAKIRAAAPFVSRTAVGSLADQRGVVVWRGERMESGKRISLHAKIVDVGTALVLGSANLTSQALLGRKGRPINHETVVLMDPLSRTRIESLLKGFDKLSLEELDDSGEVPGDLDAADEDIKDFLEARRLSLAAPRKAELILRPVPAPGNVSLLLSAGAICGKRVVRHSTLVLKAHDDSATICLPSSRVATPVSVPRSSWRTLARWLLRRQTIFVEGHYRNRVVWKRELDWGDSWAWALGIPAARLGPIVSSSRSSPMADEDHTITSDYPDVRELLRRMSDAAPNRLRRIRGIDGWIQRHAALSPSSSGRVPAWIEGLLDRLHGFSGGDN